MQKIKPVILTVVAMTVLFSLTAWQTPINAENKSEPSPQTVYIPKPALPIPVSLAVTDTEAVDPPESESLMSDEDVALIALVTMGEAEGECEKGKRLVIDTILNRVDSPYFPDTVRGVVYQPNHFSVMRDGRIERCYVREDICQLVREELESRTNHDVIFFNSGHYSKYGTPLFRVEHHYFSSY